MRARTAAPLACAAALAVLLSTAPPAGAATGRLEMYSAPGLNYHVIEGGGCHNFSERAVSYADSTPVATYRFYTGRDCTGMVLGAGRDATQWIPPLLRARSVDLRFED
ncbi:hypothetical protein [Marinitenerispora sediminis]|uniref:Uncharacterized protein n=1 Tax=Marinitenerispora sediminis TaxID=1931232 RepID=A0A368T9K2_9ACTN|nr:hypothetical protein [Marinitenerispora sediminis]RCV54876.1 hypothetical protein DEF28_07225 [Marinitenerispora sediminis]RCV59261.1 hypothetical protein DEF24_10335 [Marinitenerispora sediminis]RCV60277.1 hypothetical protein DEF23_05140 [Marinitenerispora sediminis]